MRLLETRLVLVFTAVYLKSNIVCVKQTEQRPFSVIEICICYILSSFWLLCHKAECVTLIDRAIIVLL